MDGIVGRFVPSAGVVGERYDSAITTQTMMRIVNACGKVVGKRLGERDHLRMHRIVFIQLVDDG